MAGMFYSLQEAADKLGKTQEEIKLLATEGKLREFRDGSNIMFKIDEVEALLTSDEPEQIEDLDLVLEPTEEAGDVDELLDLEPVGEDGALDMSDDLLLEPDSDSQDAESLDEDLDALLGFADDDGSAQESSAEEENYSLLMADDSDDLGLVEPDLDVSALDGDDDIGLGLSDTQMAEDTPQSEDSEGESDILLASDSTGLADGNMDTAISGEEGINLLGETDGDFKLTDDTMAETLAGLGATGETSLEEIEDDLSLDSFGSGSGLLDLSLQADDTSLGGILDEIYTSDGDEGSPAEDNFASDDNVMSESETLPVDQGLVSDDAFVPAVPMAIRSAEIRADASSRMLGGLLFIPLFMMLYTSIIAISGMNARVPTVLSVVKPWIWYILGGLMLVAIIMSVMALTKSDGPKAPRAKKAKKAKGAKKEKAPKEKKVKKKKERKAKKT